MAINKNHEVEELNGVRCAVVERGISFERCEFLRQILVHNKYKVHIQIINTAAKINNLINHAESVETLNYTIGVEDLGFNVINAIYGRLLKDIDNYPISFDYWNQKIENNFNQKPYFY